MNGFLRCPPTYPYAIPDFPLKPQTRKPEGAPAIDIFAAACKSHLELPEHLQTRKMMVAAFVDAILKFENEVQPGFLADLKKMLESRS